MESDMPLDRTCPELVEGLMGRNPPGPSTSSRHTTHPALRQAHDTQPTRPFDKLTAHNPAGASTGSGHMRVTSATSGPPAGPDRPAQTRPATTRAAVGRRLRDEPRTP